MAKKKETNPIDLLPEDFEKDLVPSDSALATISALAEQQLKLESEAADLEQKLKDKNEELRKVRDIELPQAMKSAGIADFKTTDGAKVTVKDDMSMSISAEKKPFVLGWLRKNNHDDIIKAEVVVTLPKGTDPKIRERLLAGVQKLKLGFVEQENVNTATMKALLKEQREKGVAIDLQKFGAYEYSRAIIKLPK